MPDHPRLGIVGWIFVVLSWIPSFLVGFEVSGLMKTYIEESSARHPLDFMMEIIIVGTVSGAALAWLTGRIVRWLILRQSRRA